MGDKSLGITAQMDIDDVKEGLNDLINQFSQIPDNITTDINLTGDAQTESNDLKATLDEIAGSDNIATVDVGGDAPTEAANIKNELESIDGLNPNINITATDINATDVMGNVEAEADSLNGKEIDIDVGTTGDNLDETDTSVTKLSSDTDDATDSTASFARGLGNLIAPLTGLKASSDSLDFSKSLEQTTIWYKLSGSAASDYTSQMEKVIDSNKNASVGVNNIAGGFKELASLGVDKDSALAEMPSMVSIATRNSMDLNNVVDTGTSIMRLWNLSGNDAKTTLDELNYSAQQWGQDAPGYISLFQRMSQAMSSFDIDPTQLMGITEAMQKGGASLTQVARAFRNPSAMNEYKTNLDKAVSGTGDAKKALDELGVSIVKNADGTVNYGQTMVEVSDALGRVSDPTKEATLATEIFGNQVGQSFGKIKGEPSDYAQEIQTSGAQTTKDLGQSASDHKDLLARIKVYWDDLIETIGTLPTVVQLGLGVLGVMFGGAVAGQMIKWMVHPIEQTKVFAEAMKNLPSNIRDGVSEAGDLIESIGNFFKTPETDLASFFDRMDKGLIEVQGPIQSTESRYTQFINDLKTKTGGFKETGESIIDNLKAGIDEKLPTLDSISNKILTSLKSTLPSFRSEGQQIVESINEGIESAKVESPTVGTGTTSGVPGAKNTTPKLESITQPAQWETYSENAGKYIDTLSTTIEKTTPSVDKFSSAKLPNMSMLGGLAGKAGDIGMVLTAAIDVAANSDKYYNQSIGKTITDQVPIAKGTPIDTVLSMLPSEKQVYSFMGGSQYAEVGGQAIHEKMAAPMQEQIKQLEKDPLGYIGGGYSDIGSKIVGSLFPKSGTSSISSAVSGFGKTISDTIGSIIPESVANFPSIGDPLHFLTGNLFHGEGAESVGLAAKEVVNEIKHPFEGFEWPKLPSFDAGKTLSSGVKTVESDLGGFVDKVKTFKMPSAKDLAFDLGHGITEGAATGVNALASFISSTKQAGGQLKADVGNIGNSFKTGLSEAGNSVKNGVGTIQTDFGNFKNYITKLPSQISTGAHGIWNNLSSGATQGKNTVVNDVKSVQQGFGNFSNYLKTLPNQVSTNAHNVWNGVTNGATQAKTNTVNGANSIKTNFNNFSNYLKTLPGQISTEAHNIWNSVTSGVDNGINTVKSKINGLIGWVESLPGILRADAQNAIDGIRNGINTGIADVNNSLKTLETDFWNDVNWIKEAPGNFYNWGKSILGSFVDGIKSGMPDLNGALANLAKVVETHSPPKEGPLSAVNAAGWNNFGSSLMQGFSTGISSELGSLNNSLSSTVSLVDSKFNEVVNSSTDFLGDLDSVSINLFSVGSSMMDNLIGGISNGLPGLDSVFNEISGMFPHSPPKTGPLSTITTANMKSWAASVAGAGVEGFGKLNEYANNKIQIPNVPNIPTSPIPSSNQSGQTVIYLEVAEGAVLVQGNATKDVIDNGGSMLGTSLAGTLKRQAGAQGVNVINNMG